MDEWSYEWAYGYTELMYSVFFPCNWLLVLTFTIDTGLVFNVVYVVTETKLLVRECHSIIKEFVLIVKGGSRIFFRCSSGLVVWGQPVILEILVWFPCKQCCLLLFPREETLLTLLQPRLQSTKLYWLGNVRQHQWLYFLEQETLLTLQCSSLPSFTEYLAVLSLTGEGRA